MAHPYFSVVIATFNNRGRTLGRAIDSIRAQTLRDFEIIIVDDGSSDEESFHIAGVLAGELKPSTGVQVLTQPHAGPGVARNHGVRNAVGEWVVFLDDDDEWDSEKLAHLRCTIERDEPDFVYTGMGIHDSNGQLVSIRVPVAPNDLLKTVRLECPVVPSVMAFRKSYFERTGGFLTDLMGFEDWALLAVVARDCAEGRARVSALTAPLTRYYRLPTSMSAGAAWRTMLRKELRLNGKRGLLDYGLSGASWLRWWLRRYSETFYTHGVGARDSGSPWNSLILIGTSICLWPLRRKSYKALVVAALRVAGKPHRWPSTRDSGIKRPPA